ncbi:uncharacterized protein LOC132904136 [Amyelois transitella]|uniref:uncharacterized protein LOC132904136 n=1 Tax=Amyelois transitella TaxID=680683 RepID=UPI002990680F|nr:uncharacterized protein LOC132904136 [Amyelois transitella]
MCMQLVIVYGRPLALINDPPFQAILHLAASSSPRSKEINIKSIKTMIPTVAYDIKLKIAAEVRNKLICIKVDSATCQDRRFLGINIQYIQNHQIFVRNLSVSEINERQTGDFLKEKVLEVLNDFLISKEQIYVCDTDNGSNMKKMTKLIEGNYCSEDLITSMDTTDDTLQSNIIIENESDDEESFDNENEIYEQSADNDDLGHVLFDELRRILRLSLDTDIISYWSNKSTTHLDITLVALTVLASPATQVSGERLFSSLKFILSPLRSNLSSILVQNILFIRWYKDLI